MRVKIDEPPGIAARKVQDAINNIQEFEGLPLGRIQNLGQLVGQPFEVIFSMHFKEELDQRIWKLLNASPDLPPDVSNCFYVLLPYL